MIRKIYIQLLWMHPRAFRQRFGDEMLDIFDQSPEKASLLTDAVASLVRQKWMREPAPAAFPNTAAADGVPLFYSSEPEIPSTRALMRGTFVALLAFAVFSVAMSYRWKQTSLIVGSHHPSPSNILGAHTDAKAEANLPAEVKMAPYPYHPPVSPYFQLVLVLAALDVDEDNVISIAEIENAPAGLWKLDRNHDGKLTAAECGLKPEPNADAMTVGRLRLGFMRIHPVLAALDTNGDGEISGSEIRNAAAALRTLDANSDGKLVEAEVRPDGAVLMASNIMFALDKNGDGRISQEEKTGAIAVRLRDLLKHADRTSRGYVTEDDLLTEIRLSEANRRE